MKDDSRVKENTCPSCGSYLADGNMDRHKRISHSPAVQKFLELSAKALENNNRAAEISPVDMEVYIIGRKPNGEYIYGVKVCNGKPNERANS